MDINEMCIEANKRLDTQLNIEVEQAKLEIRNRAKEIAKEMGVLREFLELREENIFE